jgi:hypothetical protein
VTFHVLTEERYDRPWAREQSDAFHFLGRVLRYEDGDLDQVAIDAAVEGDDVSSVGILEFIHVARHPDASERCLENFDDNRLPSNLVADCRQDRRMKDNILIKRARP